MAPELWKSKFEDLVIFTDFVQLAGNVPGKVIFKAILSPVNASLGTNIVTGP